MWFQLLVSSLWQCHLICAPFFLVCFEAFLLHTKLILNWLVWHLFVPNVTISCKVDFHILKVDGTF